MVDMARGWITADESAKEMLGRVRKERLTLYLPDPLNKVPIGVGDIVEIIGPSSSAKTEILLQMAINCILPGHRNGVHYGGLVHSVLFLDLDCRFEILRLSQSLKLRIIEAANRSSKMTKQPKDVDVSKSCSQDLYEDDDKDLFRECMRKFSYIRCYDSFQFLAALKLLHSKVLKERKTCGPGVYVLMIDSIGAFYWMDRGFSSLPQGVPKRKNLSLQSVLETVVQEIKQLLQLHPMLVLVTRTATLGDRHATNQIKRSFPTLAPSTASEMKNRKGGFKNILYREYMPSVWQSFVTHRILVRASDDERMLHDRASYLAEWLPPVPNLSGKFFVSDAGISPSL